MSNFPNPLNHLPPPPPPSCLSPCDTVAAMDSHALIPSYIVRPPPARISLTCTSTPPSPNPRQSPLPTPFVPKIRKNRKTVLAKRTEPKIGKLRPLRSLHPRLAPSDFPDPAPVSAAPAKLAPISHSVPRRPRRASYISKQSEPKAGKTRPQTEASVARPTERMSFIAFHPISSVFIRGQFFPLHPSHTPRGVNLSISPLP